MIYYSSGIVCIMHQLRRAVAILSNSMAAFLASGGASQPPAATTATQPRHDHAPSSYDRIQRLTALSNQHTSIEQELKMSFNAHSSKTLPTRKENNQLCL